MSSAGFYSRLNNQRGLSLLEAALVLGVLGLVIAGIWVLSAGAFGTSKKNRLAEQVIGSVEGIRSYMRTADIGTSTTLYAGHAWDLGLLPADVRRAGAFRNPYNGNFGITFTISGIFIFLTNIPADACTDLIYSRLGGGTNVAADFGFVGYAFATAIAPTSNTFTFKEVTEGCNSNTNLMLRFTPQ